MECIHKVWERMIAGNIRQVCSLGCGPGSDAVGLVAFLQWIGEANLEVTSDGSKETCHDINERQPCSLERILLFDFAIDDWIQVLEPLIEVLGKEKPETKIHWGYCDVSHPFASVRYGDATLPMYRIEESDIFLISYLLTETRGQWELFFQQLIDCAKPHSVFYFAEPTPWQLHGFKELFQDNVDFIWLDSSMDHPNLQPLDGRVGPAVLLGIKK
jgi:SAM-dependent methyltransferase